MAARTAPVYTETTGEVKKRRRASGPRKIADTHVFVRVLDANGNHLPDAKLEIGHTTKDTKSAIEYMDSPNGRDFKRFVVKGKQIGGNGAEANDGEAEVTQD